MILALLALFSCAKPVAIEPLAEASGTHQFALEIRGHTLAGLASFQIDGDTVTMDGLSPAGTALFRVVADGSQVEVRAPDENWAAALERLPFRRDVLLVYAWACPAERCAVGDGIVTEERMVSGRVLRRWKGPDGPARVEIFGDKAVLTDPRRGYTVTMIGSGIDRGD